MSSPGVGPASPDLSNYVNLKVYDRTDQQIIETALGRMRLDMPELVIREGAIEVMLLESLALETNESVVAINRLPGAAVETVLHLAGVDKDYGAPAFTTATITLGDTLGHTIPGGTRFYLPLGDGRAVTFLAEPPNLIIPVGADTGVLNLVSAEFTGDANGVPVGSVLVPADPLPFIERVVTASAVADGRGPETDEAWRTRGVQRLARLSDALVIPRHFEAAAGERPEVGRAMALDNYDPAQAGVPGDHAGHITVAVLATDGTLLSADAKSDITAYMEERAATMLVVHVIDVAVQTITIAATVTVMPGFDAATVQSSVVDTVKTYLDPLQWQWGQTIYHNEMVALLDAVSGVDRVVTVTVNGSAGDVELNSPSTLPRSQAADITITVQGG